MVIKKKIRSDFQEILVYNNSVVYYTKFTPKIWVNMKQSEYIFNQKKCLLTKMKLK